MANTATSNNTPKLTPVFGAFFPLPALWTEAENSPLFNSEYSARWFLRKHRAALCEAQAIAIFTGRTLVNPVKFAQVAEKVAIEAAGATA